MLLWLPPGPLHLEPSGFVPIRVDSLSERASPTATGTVATGPKAAVTSFAKLGFLVTPVMHRVVDEPTNTPFLKTSARRSNCVPWSSLFLRPRKACRSLRALSV